MAFEETRFVWKDGEIIKWRDATIHLASHALHYGSGVFEGVRCYHTVRGSAIFRLSAHLERLYHSANIYGIEIPYTPRQIEEAIASVIKANNFTGCYIRPIVYYGYGSLSVNPKNCPVEVAILTWPWAAYLGEQGLVEGVRVTICSWVKFHSSMIPATAKACGQYLNSILAVRQAHDNGFDEAILLNRDGYVAEGSGENIFIVKNGEIYTNDENSDVLLGVTRESVIQLAEDLGYKVNIKLLSVGDLLNADEAFFTGTAAEVTPIREVDGKVIGHGRRGPITESIQRVFFDIVAGKLEKYDEWLHFIS